IGNATIVDIPGLPSASPTAGTLKRCPSGFFLPAGEIAEALDTKPSTTSVYLSALTGAGLLDQRRAGTSLLYRINMEAAQAVVSDLFLDCCKGRPDLCPPFFYRLSQKTPLWGRTSHPPYWCL
ncbi:MAG: helix-turn-helix domain-containing protein, partial [Cyanobacteria bacterium P01_A01_bin.137]